jgi:hypothetical protein
VKRRPRLTRARLRELLRYNKRTGEFRWRKRLSSRAAIGDVAGCPFGTHWVIGIDGRSYRAHRLAWFYVTGGWGRPTIDHRDGNSANNRWSNLRRATSAQNNANRRRPRNNTSGLKGVSVSRTERKWEARITKNGRCTHLGRFLTAEAAHKAYVKAARKLFGEFARTE